MDDVLAQHFLYYFNNQ